MMEVIVKRAVTISMTIMKKIVIMIMKKVILMIDDDDWSND